MSKPLYYTQVFSPTAPARACGRLTRACSPWLSFSPSVACSRWLPRSPVGLTTWRASGTLTRVLVGYGYALCVFEGLSMSVRDRPDAWAKQFDENEEINAANTYPRLREPFFRPVPHCKPFWGPHRESGGCEKRDKHTSFRSAPK